MIGGMARRSCRLTSTLSQPSARKEVHSMRILTTTLLLAALAGPAAAQQATQSAQPTAQVTEETIERGLVNLGLMAGHAFQCAPEADRPAAQRALLDFHSILVAQLGGNAAFRFATAFGAGSSHEVDPQHCDRSLADWRKHVQEHRLDR
jgi:hypothetical protein